MSRRLILSVAAGLAIAAALYALAGFVLLPALIERRLPAHATERFGIDLSVGDTAFNPFLLRLQAQDVRVAAAPGQAPLLTVDRAVLDLAWASLWTRTWTVSPLQLQSAHARVEIDSDGRLNWARLLDRPESGPPQPPAALWLQQAALRDGQLTLTDRRGDVPRQASLTGIEIEASDVTTRAEEGRQGHYRLAATLPQSGSVRAQGTLALAPALRSTGAFELAGLSLPAVWPLLRGALGLDLAAPADTVDAKANYAYAAAGDTPTLTLDAAELQLTGVALHPDGSEAPLLRLKRLTARGGGLDLAARKLAFAEVRLSDGALAFDIGTDGRLRARAPAGFESEPGSTSGSAAPAGVEPTAPTAWHARIDTLHVEGVSLHASDHSRPIPLALDVAAIQGSASLSLDFGAAATQTRLSALSARLEAPRLSAVGADEPLLAFDVLTIGGATVDTGDRLVRVDQVEVEGGSAALQLAEGGPPGLLQALRAGGGPEPATPAEPAAAPKDWRYALTALRAEGVALRLRHGGYEPAIVYTAALTDTTLSNVGSEADGPMRLDARLAFEGDGTLTAKGRIAQDGALVDAELQLERLPLRPLQPLLARHARLELQSGRLSAQAQLQSDGADGDAGLALLATGSAHIEDVRIDEAASGDRFLEWRSLRAEGVTLDTQPGRLSIRDIELQEPGAKLVIAQDRSVNLTQVLRDGDGAGVRAATDPDTRADTGGEARAGERQAAGVAEAPRANRAGGTGTGTAPDAAPFAVTIDRLRLQRGTLDYADLSLVLPFSTQITALRGSVLGITTARGERARVQAAGEIQRFGSARVSGSLLPFAPTEFLDLRVRFDNVAMPPLSPYTATFAGRTVAEGKLWLDLDYRIENGQLLGENEIRLADFRLGERVDAPNALDLPLELAVALLTDEQGRIELAVPVRGDIGDPSFDIGALVREALGNLLQRVVTAPFRALGRLFGGGGDDRQLAEIEFRAGSHVLAPPQREKLEEVARALAQRPRLQLVLNGPYAPEQDAQALRRREARRELARALGAEPAAGESPGLVAYESERTQRALEALLTKYAGERALRELPPEDDVPAQRATNAAAVPPAPSASDTTGTAAKQGRYRAMFDRLAASMPLPDAALPLLAARRADAMRDYLIGEAKAPADRVKTAPIQAVKASDDRAVSATLTLDVAAPAGDARPPPGGQAPP